MAALLIKKLKLFDILSLVILWLVIAVLPCFSLFHCHFFKSRKLEVSTDEQYDKLSYCLRLLLILRSNAPILISCRQI